MKVEGKVKERVRANSGPKFWAFLSGQPPRGSLYQDPAHHQIRTFAPLSKTSPQICPRPLQCHSDYIEMWLLALTFLRVGTAPRGPQEPRLPPMTPGTQAHSPPRCLSLHIHTLPAVP